jgi:hypothetical protein
MTKQAENMKETDERTKAMDSMLSEDRMFNQKFIEEVKNMSYLKDKKNYTNMRLSRILDSFVQNSSIMGGNTTMQSNMKESTASMFSKHTSSSRLIPERTLQVLEREPDCKFSAQLLHQRLVKKMIADPETTRKAIYNIQKKLLEKKRRQIAKENLEKKEAKVKKLDKKIILRASKEKLFQKGVKRISIDDRDRFIQTISRIKSRNANLTQKTDLLPA